MVGLLGVRLLWHAVAVLASAIVLWSLTQLMARRCANPRFSRALLVGALIYLAGEALLLHYGPVLGLWTYAPAVVTAALILHRFAWIPGPRAIVIATAECLAQRLLIGAALAFLGTPDLATAVRMPPSGDAVIDRLILRLLTPPHTADSSTERPRVASVATREAAAPRPTPEAAPTTGAVASASATGAAPPALVAPPAASPAAPPTIVATVPTTPALPDAADAGEALMGMPAVSGVMRTRDGAFMVLHKGEVIRKDGLVSTFWQGEKRWWQLKGVTNDTPVWIRLQRPGATPRRTETVTW